MLRHMHAPRSSLIACAAAVRTTVVSRQDLLRRLGHLAMLAAAVACAFLLYHPPALADEAACGFPAHIPEGGPYDYTLTEAVGVQYGGGKNRLKQVETYHFSPGIENLTQRVNIGSDLDFVLRYFPNHHRALDALGRLGIREKAAKASNTSFTIDCYFVRAMRFAPEDFKVRVIYGIYLAKLGNLKKALEQYQEAERVMPDSINVTYNLGLLYFELKDYDKSLEYAKKAYSRGVTLPGLKNKLAKAGKWPSGLVITATPATPTPVPPSGQDTPANEGDSKPAPR